MTNFEKIKNMDEIHAFKEFEKLVNHKFAQYIDFEGYLKSEDKDPAEWLVIKGKANLLPSEAEIKAAGAISDEDIKKYINGHRKEVVILGKTEMMGKEYLILGDLENVQIIKAPAEIVEIAGTPLL